MAAAGEPTFRPSAIEPSWVMVADTLSPLGRAIVTLLLTGPSTMAQISAITSLNLRPDLAMSDGLVVTPSSSPRSFSSWMS